MKKNIFLVFIIMVLLLIVPNVNFKAAEISEETIMELLDFPQKNGIFQCEDNKLYYYKEGKIQTNYTGVFFDDLNCWYVKNGVVDTAYNGFAQDSKKNTFYVEKGIVNFEKNGLIKGKINGSENLWYVKNSKVLNNFSGVKKFSGIYYIIKNGSVNSKKSGLIKVEIKNKTNFFYVKYGKITLRKTGFVKAKFGKSTGWYYVKNSKLMNKYSGIIKGKINDQTSFWYVKNGKINFKTNSVLKGEVNGKKGNWYIQNGKIDLKFSGIVKYAKKNIFIKKGKYDKTFTNIVTSNGEKWNVILGNAHKVKNSKDKTLSRAIAVVVKVTKPTMSKKQKLRKCYDYVKDAYTEKNPRVPHYHGKNWEIIYANDMFVNGVGNCMSYAAAFGFIAKAIGYDNVYACNSGGHGWAEINGRIFDPEWERHKKGQSYYNKSYDEIKNPNYKGGISPGYEWMHVKI